MEQEKSNGSVDFHTRTSDVDLRIICSESGIFGPKLRI